jgi:60 kDa SS-A/Ro ribonucleoprotein
MSLTDPYAAINLRATPQSEQADPRQVENSAGGYTFTLDDEARIRRFLVLGSDGATYYTSAKDLTKDNAQVVIRAAQNDARKLVDILLEISLAGRAPKQNPTLFALAAVTALGNDPAEAERLDKEIAEIEALIKRTVPPGHQVAPELGDRLRDAQRARHNVEADARRYALAALPQIARTGTHLFLFARYVEQFRGWGRGLRKAVGRWYLDKSVDSLAYQAVKYRQREGWSHRDLLRLSHPETTEPERKALFDWISGREASGLPKLVEAFETAQRLHNEPGVWSSLVQMGLSWEMLPDEALGHVKVWEALVDKGIPMTALIRQLPRLTRLGVARTKRAEIIKQITDPEHLRKARIHPVNVLVALRTYASGKSARGESSWTPDRHIIDALDEAFYRSFDFVEPANKRILLALDVSGSMGSPISNLPLTCREAAAAIAMTLLRTEKNADVVGFTSGTGPQGWYYGRSRSGVEQADAVSELAISARQRLDDILRYTSALDFGGTDCAAPMLWALKHGREYDATVLATDNETWAGAIHPHQALTQYRQRTGIPMKMIILGMTATPFSIADPNDAGSLDVAGFDSAVPTLISDFIRGL